ncbi:hypothetical protein [Tessaracoccus caeni]|uniref:hypothetical protein n=1 Tax=Tessaracoccus caeni TaxID=3031239 RepID=UPI0023DA4212|nr:hypothetical protein [Tessaracoccus caeni]MDF1489841.1 hypothetical protein [Tessaracoccus caeni]
METLRAIVVLSHLVGFAMLFGGWAVEAAGQRRINRVMHWGLAIAAVAGLALAAPWGGAELNYAKIAVKLVVLLVIGALLGIGQARQRKSPEGKPSSAVFWAVGLLTLGNAAVAVLW